MEEIIKLLENERDNITIGGDKIASCKVKYINNYIRYIKKFNKFDYKIDKEYISLYDRFRDSFPIISFIIYIILIYCMIDINVVVPSKLACITFLCVVYFKIVDKKRVNEIIYKMNLKETKEFIKYDKYIKRLINNKLNNKMNNINKEKVCGIKMNEIVYLKEYLKNMRDYLDNCNHNENRNVYKTSEEELLYRELGNSYDDLTERVNEEVIEKIKKYR